MWVLADPNGRRNKQNSSKSVCQLSFKIFKGLSGGSILLILVFVVIIVYLIIGIGLQKLKHGATGTDVIPNKSFWFGCGGLVKDGGMFLAGKITGKKKQYESI